MNQSSDNRPLDLVIDGHDISQYVGDWATCKESRAEWVVHTELVFNQYTSAILQPLYNKNVSVKYRLRNKAEIFPWYSGSAEVYWRLTENGGEELILHGTGRLNKGQSESKATGATVTAKIEMATLIGGKVIQRDEGVGTISFVEEDPHLRAVREEQLRLAQQAEIQSITSPEFVLFLANSALSSFRLLYHSGISNQNSQLLYSSLIFLPLATEYFMKYLLVKGTGTFEKKYRIHKQLTLFDFLPPDIQESIENEFKNELENIGRPREYQALRVFLKRSQNAFTAIRYLFDPANAETSKHLLEPENTAILTCLSSALERVSKGISYDH